MVPGVDRVWRWRVWLQDPIFLILYTALQFYFLSGVQEVASALTLGGCEGLFGPGNDDYCKEHWASFLLFCTFCYQGSMLILAFTSVWIFSYLHLGPVGISSPLRQPLLPAGRPTDNTQEPSHAAPAPYQDAP